MNFTELLTFLKTNDDFLLVSHADPDGDAVGSEYAMRGILRQLGKKASILNSDRSSKKYLFFDREHQVHSLEEGHPVPKNIGAMTVLLLDTSDFLHTGKAKDVLFPFARQIVIIDHHTPPLTLPCPAYIDETAAATCQIMFDVAQALGTKLDLNLANAIFLGLVFDTGSFIYSKTSPRTFEVAQHLTQAGVVPKDIHSQLYETIEPSRMKLLAKVQSTMELLDEDRIAVQFLEQKMLEESGALPDDSENFINYPLKCSTVLVSILFKKIGESNVRCSMRSKGSVDISKIALTYGGGGHKNAAGFPCPNVPLEQFRPVLLKLVGELL